MLGYVVVFVGAGLGGAVRHGMNIWVTRWLGAHFPSHTFVINILGSLLMGLIAGWFAERGQACVLACQGQRAERAQAAGQAVEVVQVPVVPHRHSSG